MNLLRMSRRGQERDPRGRRKWVFLQSRRSFPIHEGLYQRYIEEVHWRWFLMLCGSLVYIATNKTYDVPCHSQRQLRGTTQPHQTSCNLQFVTLFTLSRLSSLFFDYYLRATKQKLIEQQTNLDPLVKSFIFHRPSCWRPPLRRSSCWRGSWYKYIFLIKRAQQRTFPEGVDKSDV